MEGPLCPDSAAMKELPHSSNLRLHRLADVPATFFVTKSLFPKRPLLTAELRHIITDSFRYALEHERIHLRAFVVMPDHWHALFAIREPWTLPRFMHSLMSHIAAETSSYLALHGCIWQDSYYETRVRTPRQFGYIAHYVEQNPVKAGFVDSPHQWEASSAARTDLVTDPWPWLVEQKD
jgi:putative transposase